MIPGDVATTALEKGVEYVAFIAAMMAFSYAFYQRGWWFIIPEGIYIGAFTALSLTQIYKSFRGMAWDYVMAGQVVLLIPIIIGLLAFTRVTRFRWLARYPVAILSGAGVGALFGLSLRGQFLAVIADTAAAVASPDWDIVSKILFVVMFLAVVSRFIYSRRFSNILYDKGQPLYYVQRFGRIAFMAVVGFQLYGYFSIMRPLMLIQTVIKPVLEDIAALIGLL